MACEVALVEGVQVNKAEQMISETLDNGGSPEAHEEATGETTVREVHQPILTNRKIRQLAEQAMKRLYPR